MPLTRKPNWDTQDLHTFLTARMRMPFAWGSNDCCIFPADGILAVTGVDVAADFRGKYTDEAGAWATLQGVCGGSSVADAAVYCAQKACMAELQHPLMAQRGDLVTLEDSGRMIAGLVHLNGSKIAAMGAGGWMLRPITDVLRAWHY